MAKLNKKDIIDAYEIVKKKALKAYSRKQYNQSLDYVGYAARIANRFNWIYTDDDLEKLLKDISSRILPSKYEGETVVGRYVFYDFRAADNCCLTQQYLRAFMAWGVEILYIPEVLDASKANSIIKELSSYNKVRIVPIQRNKTSVVQIISIYEEIIAFKPEKIFLQLAPWSANAVALFNAFPTITKYYIDLTDHAFNLGTSCTDYTIEFRSRGCTIALEKRNWSSEKILLQPYYPIIEKNKFLGFPPQVTSDKVVIFSGGSYYKIYGKKDIYFNILKKIVEDNPSVIVLYAGIGGSDKKFRQFIDKNKLNDKIIILGFRKDINEVFEHCDIYLNTYPVSGGLMSQYASVNGKPVIAYNTTDRRADFVESLICDNTDINITFTNLKDLFEEAKKMIDDKSYRINQGEMLKKCISTPEQFNKDLYQIITTNTNIKSFNIVDINYDAVVERYLNLENDYSSTFKIMTIKKFGIKSLFLFPKLVLLMIPITLSFLWRKIERMIKNIVSH